MKNNESMIAAAVAILTENGEAMKFSDLWAKVIARLEIPEEEATSRIGHFYTDLSFCGAVVVLSDNTWDLRSRHNYDAVHIDVSAVYTEVEDNTDLDQTDLQENAEYDQSVQGIVTSTGVLDEESEEDDSTEGSQSRERDAATEALGVKGDM